MRVRTIAYRIGFGAGLFWSIAIGRSRTATLNLTTSEGDAMKGTFVYVAPRGKPSAFDRARLALGIEEIVSKQAT